MTQTILEKTMKKFTVKNYKGNLVESLKKFSDSHKEMKIVEAIEDGKELKIKTEESEKINEEMEKNVYVLMYIDEYGEDTNILGIYSSKDKALRVIKERNLLKSRSINLLEYPLNVFTSKDYGKSEGKAEFLPIYQLINQVS